MLKHLPVIGLFMIFLVAGCSTPGSHETVSAPYLGFSEYPFGDDVRLSRTQPQKGGGLAAPVRDQSFREITIAQGSGFAGFASIRIFADGSGYAITPQEESRVAKVTFQLSKQEMSLLLRAINKDRLHRIKGSYSAGMDDGVQGFVELVTSEGRVYSWLDNYFTPVTHLYSFCNSHVWEGAFRRPVTVEWRRSDTLQDEYKRVFTES